MSETILALDAASAACSVAVWRAGEIVAHRELLMARGHAEALMPLVLETMAAAKLEFCDLTRIAVGVGPGSFTGIRIALATARGLALAAGLPVAGVDSFSAVAAGVSPALRRGRTLLVVIDSKRRELFGRYFDSELGPASDPLVGDPDALLYARPPGPLLIAGDGAHLLPGLPDATRVAGPGRPDAASIARLAAEGRALLAPRPVYLRAPDVTLL